MIKRLLKRIFNYYGYEIKKPNLREDHLKRRMKLINTYNINTILDVGANTGQYGKVMRTIGYRGKIVSFEPVGKSYQELLINTKKDTDWTALNYALGNFDGTTQINIAGNSVSSSMLDMLPSHLKHRPASKYIDKELINIIQLDTVFESIYKINDIVLLKIDAQGFEYNILEGASYSLSHIKGIQLEMSLEPLYDKEKSMCEMIDYLLLKGFKLMSLEPGSIDLENGQMFQVDGVFIKG
jgi:FkbM family methyltransferase